MASPGDDGGAAAAAAAAAAAPAASEDDAPGPRPRTSFEDVGLTIKEDIVADKEAEEAEEDPARNQLTLGRGTVNALTFRSFVDPQEQRPDMTFYRGRENPHRQRSSFMQLQYDDFKSPEQLEGSAEVRRRRLRVGRTRHGTKLAPTKSDELELAALVDEGEASRLGADPLAGAQAGHAIDRGGGGMDASPGAAAPGAGGDDKPGAVGDDKPDAGDDNDDDGDDDAAAAAAAQQKKFGTWDGVFASCLLNIFGVIMFLRLGWVVGQAGVPLAVLIISIATVVTTLTTLSMSAIATNGEVKAGGAYYLISRSIGPNVGGAVGFLFAVGMSVAVALYIIGFCETLVEQLFDTFSPTGDELNDVRLYGLILLAVILVMAMIGVEWVIKLQLWLLALLVMAIVFFLLGTGATPTDEADGFVGYGGGVLGENSSPDFQPSDGVDYNFFSVFAVFFPAVTGIMAGANISGDLRNPSEAIPAGTLWAIGVSWVVYSGMAVAVGAVTRRVVDGDEDAGLLGDNLIMVKISVWGPLVLGGIYAATFSSALASLVGAPRVLQRLAADGIIPLLNPFAAVRASDGAPVRGYLFTTVVAAGCVLIGKLNLVAPLITMLFMLCYAFINFACFALTLSHSPGWRPSFTAFTWWSSLLGSLLCVSIMFLTDYLWAVIALLLGLAIFKYVEWKDPDVNWGSAAEARKDLSGVRLLMSLRHNRFHVKTFRPHYLVMTGEPYERTHLVRFADTLRRGHGAVIFANVKTGNYNEMTLTKEEVSDLQAGYWESVDHSIASFYESIVADSLHAGARALVQLAGIGRIRPNTLVLGYKADWSEGVEGYVGAVRDAFKMELGVMVCRGLKKLDWVPRRGGGGGGGEAGAAAKKASTLDVWWLVDDGGLTVLVPYLMSLHEFWRSHTATGGSRVATGRLFVVVSGKVQDVMGLYQMVATMLTHFRIQWDVQVIRAEPTAPRGDTVAAFEELVGTGIDELIRPHVMRRWLRVGELLHEHSSEAAVAVCTMPFPRDADNPRAWLGLLEMLSRDMPPTILMRGNGSNVLTFQSE